MAKKPINAVKKTTKISAPAIRQTLTAGGKKYAYYSLEAASKALKKDLSRMPYSMKVLLENLLRFEDGVVVTRKDIEAFVKGGMADYEIQFTPARVLMQDFTGVPAVVDLAAMRDAMKSLKGDPKKINPLVPVDLVIDHSVMVDKAGNSSAFKENVRLEMERNDERYKFLKWGQGALDGFSVVPPGTGICHQVNLEYLAKVVWTKKEGKETIAYPDTLVGTDSHTTMINGLAVLGWGVGGIEAEAAMLGQPVSMLIPEVVGFKLTGKMKEGTTATDLVLTITQMLRKHGVVGKFVEFYGPGLDNLPLADRATIANMAPEYGATCGFFPIDKETVKYLELSARPKDTIELVKAYAKKQGMWRDAKTPDPMFREKLALDLGKVTPTIAGPTKPQEKVVLSEAALGFKILAGKDATPADMKRVFGVQGRKFGIQHGSVLIAAITSCTNTSNPSVMLAAGLVARNALKKGLKVQPWVKTSLAPGSKVVTEYLEKSNLQKDLDALGFNLVGYGCTTCIGNSGPLPEEIEQSIRDNKLVVASVLSGNRNFEGRVHPLTKANYLMSPPLVVAYALAGNMQIDLTKDPLGIGKDGKKVYLKDIWPSNKEIAALVAKTVTAAMFKKKYADVFKGTEEWQKIKTVEGLTYKWDNSSTYIQNPPYFVGMGKSKGSAADIRGARPLAILGDFTTTDHISPAGNIAASSPAARYLTEHGVERHDFNSYGSRRGSHDVMMRGTFANVRIRNEMAPGTEGGVTRLMPGGTPMSIYDAAMQYKKSGTPLVIFGGQGYGMGSSRDWAAKGTVLLGVKAVIVEDFERIHRSNLVGMGVLPLQFKPGTTRKTLKLDGSETFDITGLGNGIRPKMEVTLTITRSNGKKENIPLILRIDTVNEIGYYEHGGILHKVVRDLAG